MHKLDARAHKSMPWKNGGGTTTEIARSPEGESLADFDWRISMAHVGSHGPFSVFEGVDRSIAILGGGGMALAVAGRGTVRLDVSSPPFAFPADIGVHATLASDPVDDLNVMTRRRRWRHLLSRLIFDAPAEIVPLGDTALVLVAQGTVVAARGERIERLGARDALVLARGEATAITPEPTCELFVADLWRTTG